MPRLSTARTCQMRHCRSFVVFSQPRVQTTVRESRKRLLVVLLVLLMLLMLLMLVMLVALLVVFKVRWHSEAHLAVRTGCLWRQCSLGWGLGPK